jgi:hypothetical protein
MEVYDMAELSQKRWLGREDSNLESGRERCGTEAERGVLTYRLIVFGDSACQWF